MAVLHNKVNRNILRQRLMDESFKRVTLSFYKYVSLTSPQNLRDQLWKEWSALGVFGRIYVAEEGINAQLSVPEDNFEAFKKNVYEKEVFKNTPFKIAVEDDGKSFFKLTIKVRKQIVADGLAPNEYDVSNVGTHLSAEEFHEKMAEPEAIIVDMRNRYESEIGHFEGAICPEADTFQEELPLAKNLLEGKQDKPVLLYCTGGIRCEKASSYLRHHGFKDVYQLHGGIIDYKRQIDQKGLKSKFKGKNFVFDERIGERITDEVLAHCHLCGASCDNHINCKNILCHRLFIQCQECAEKLEKCCSLSCVEYSKMTRSELKEIARQRDKSGQYSYKKQIRLVCSCLGNTSP